MPPAVFEPTISAGERPQTHALGALPLGPAIYIPQVNTKPDKAWRTNGQETVIFSSEKRVFEIQP